MKLFVATVFFAISSNPVFAQTTAVPTSSASPATTLTSTPVANARVTSSGWSLQCDPVRGSLACRAVDEISTSGGLIVGFVLAAQNDGKTAIAINVPLGVAIRTPIALAAGNGPMQTFTYVACEQKGCVANGTVSADLLAAMRSSKADLHVSYGYLDAQLGERNVNATLSLAGFAQVTDKLK